MSNEPPAEPPTLWGTYYPEGSVVAALPVPDEARRGAAALVEAGWPADEVHVVSGEEALSRQRAYAQRQSAIQRLKAAIPTDQGEALHEYLEAARRGEHFVVARAAGASRAEQAAAILRPHGAHMIRHYEHRFIRDL
jgi:hypothetical protein